MSTCGSCLLSSAHHADQNAGSNMAEPGPSIWPAAASSTGGAGSIAVGEVATWPWAGAATSTALRQLGQGLNAASDSSVTKTEQRGDRRATQLG